MGDACFPDIFEGSRPAAVDPLQPGKTYHITLSGVSLRRESCLMPDEPGGSVRF